MANGYTQSPMLFKGLIIQFSAPLLVPVPNIILFQYNPESITRTITPWATSKSAEATGAACATESSKAQNPLAQPCDPKESLSLSLELTQRMRWKIRTT